MNIEENYYLQTNQDSTYYSELSQAYVLNMLPEASLKKDGHSKSQYTRTYGPGTPAYLSQNLFFKSVRATNGEMLSFKIIVEPYVNQK